MQTLSAFLIGILFALGLTISNMINPNKVLNFLDFFGYWDPTLLTVMVSAVLTTFIGYRFVLRIPKPLLDKEFHWPPRRKINISLIIGGIIFGLGWGITGYCPGPAITAIATFNLDPIYFVIGMILGSSANWFFRQKE